MTGKALVTGGGKRLGREIVLYLAGRGLDVAVHYHSSKDEASKTVDDARAFGVKAEALQGDLTSESDTQTLLPRAVETLGGPLTLLVNSASVFEHDTIETATRDSWDRHIESNLRAPFVLTQAFAAQAPEPVYGGEFDEPTAQALIVNMVDQRVRKLTPHFASYTLAKMGLWALDPDCRANLRASRAGQRNRPRPDDAGNTPKPRAFRRTAQGNDHGTRRRCLGCDGRSGLFHGRAKRDRTADLHRRRAASGLADARNSGGGIGRFLPKPRQVVHCKRPALQKGYKIPNVISILANAPKSFVQNQRVENAPKNWAKP